METQRIDGHGLDRGAEVFFRFDGRLMRGFEGETVAAALLAEGEAATRTTVRGGRRGVFCGIGLCFDCLVVVNGVPNARACMTWLRDGLDVRSQHGWAAAEEA